MQKAVCALVGLAASPSFYRVRVGKQSSSRELPRRLLIFACCHRNILWPLRSISTSRSPGGLFLVTPASSRTTGWAPWGITSFSVGNIARCPMTLSVKNYMLSAEVQA